MMSTSPEHFQPDYALPPGATIAELLGLREMTQTQLAGRLGVSLKHVNQVVSGGASVSAELALGLEKVFGPSAGFWLSRESLYRADLARQHETAALEEWVEWANHFPITELKRRNIISTDAKGADLVRSLLRFLGVANPEAWSDPIAAYRKSQKFESDQFALAAWLRIAELRAAEIECKPYNNERFLAVLDEVRALTPKSPDDWQDKLVELCASAGVAVVVVDTFAGAKANGATRWLSATKALIQLSIRHRWEDIFWFTFFHEAGHVVLHRKKELFVEGLTPRADSGNTEWARREEEADKFASRLLIPPEYERQLRYLPLHDVPKFATDLGIAPAIVVGRLQHLGLIDYSKGNSYRRRFKLVDA
jgi:HTH-type transcriptional regulator/antitoxin HigA